MPDWTNHSFDYGAGTSTSFGWINISVPSASQIQQEYEEYQRECEHDDRIMEQQMREADEQCYKEMQEKAERAEEKRKYPLFFLKEGIV
jgi:hypothetical protein